MKLEEKKFSCGFDAQKCGLRLFSIDKEERARGLEELFGTLAKARPKSFSLRMVEGNSVTLTDWHGAIYFHLNVYENEGERMVEVKYRARMQLNGQAYHKYYTNWLETDSEPGRLERSIERMISPLRLYTKREAKFDKAALPGMFDVFREACHVVSELSEKTILEPGLFTSGRTFNVIAENIEKSPQKKPRWG